MKKVMQFIVAAVVAIAACGCNNGQRFSVEGTINAEGIEGGMVYLIDTQHPEAAVDSTELEDGQFVFKGSVKSPWLAVAACGEYMVQFIIEPGKVVVVDDSIGGTPLNDKLQAIRPRFDMTDYRTQVQQLYTDYYNATDESERTAIERKLDTAIAVGNSYMMTACTEVFNENKDNLLAMMMLETMVQIDMLDYATLDSLVKEATYPVEESVLVKQKLEQFRHLEQTAVGKHYTDIEGVDGRLSDLIEGKVAVVDFYASWCRPCREEISSSLLPLWNKYRSQGLVVVGLNVWERGNREAREEAHRKVVEDLCITYPQLVDSTMTATDTYGVESIPQIMLIGRDGTILARDLRGENIEEAVKEALK